MSWSTDVTLIVEFGFGSGPLAASPNWTDIVADVRAVTTDRGRTAPTKPFEPGAATVVLDNTDGKYDPNNSQSTHAGNLKNGVPVRIRATHNMTTYPIFYGHITDWDLDYDMPTEARAVFEVTENLARLHSSSVDVDYSREVSDERVAAILDDAGWPAGARDLDSGVTDVRAVEFEEAAGDLLLQTVEAEQGRLFVARDGDLTLLNRVALSGATPQATFGPGGGELGFFGLDLAYDNEGLVNKARMTTVDASEVLVISDATSIADHGEASYASFNEAILGGPYARNVAEWIVNKGKDPEAVRVRSIDIAPGSDPDDLWPEVLGRELSDLVTVKFTPPGTSVDSLDQDVAVEGIRHEIVPGRWITRYSCFPPSDFELQDFWILGTSQLGTDTRLA